MIGEMMDAAVAVDPSAVVAVVSDHGFIATHTAVNLRTRFVEAGLIKLKQNRSGTTVHASFFIRGPNIEAGRDLGVIDMRQIVPTLASILGVRLPHKTEPALQLSRLPSRPTSSTGR